VIQPNVGRLKLNAVKWQR